MDSPPQTVPIRDESFYFEHDPMATFLVEDRLFKVHRHFFIQGSTIFRDMFAQAGGTTEAEETSEEKAIPLPGVTVKEFHTVLLRFFVQGSTIFWGTFAETEGQDDTTAGEKTPNEEEESIPLPGVTVKEFQTLLRFFYAMTSPIRSDIDTIIALLAFDLDEKLALLSIAHRFVFDNIFTYMSRQIQPKDIPVVDRIRLGDKYDLTHWLSSAYEEILDRDSLEEAISEDEVGALGLDRLAKIFKAKTFILGQTLKKMRELQREGEEEHRAHKKKCSRCGVCPHQVYSRLPSHADGLTSIATAVGLYLLPRSRSPFSVRTSYIADDDGVQVEHGG